MSKYEQYLQEQEQLEEGFFKADKYEERIIGNTEEEVNQKLDKFMADNKGYSPAIKGGIKKPMRMQGGKFYYIVTSNKNANVDDKSIQGRLKRGLGLGDKEYTNRATQQKEEPKQKEKLQIKSSANKDIKSNAQQQKETNDDRAPKSITFTSTISKEDLKKRINDYIEKYPEKNAIQMSSIGNEGGKWVATVRINDKEYKDKLTTSRQQGKNKLLDDEWDKTTKKDNKPAPENKTPENKTPEQSTTSGDSEKIVNDIRKLPKKKRIEIIKSIETFNKFNESNYEKYLKSI